MDDVDVEEIQSSCQLALVSCQTEFQVQFLFNFRFFFLDLDLLKLLLIVLVRPGACYILSPSLETPRNP